MANATPQSSNGRVPGWPLAISLFSAIIAGGAGTFSVNRSDSADGAAQTALQVARDHGVELEQIRRQDAETESRLHDLEVKTAADFDKMREEVRRRLYEVPDRFTNSDFERERKAMDLQFSYIWKEIHRLNAICGPSHEPGP